MKNSKICTIRITGEENEAEQYLGHSSCQFSKTGKLYQVTDSRSIVNLKWNKYNETHT